MVRDQTDPVEDEHLADFVCRNHMKMHPEESSQDTQSVADSAIVEDKVC